MIGPTESRINNNKGSFREPSLPVRRAVKMKVFEKSWKDQSFLQYSLRVCRLDLFARSLSLMFLGWVVEEALGGPVLVLVQSIIPWELQKIPFSRL
jgi:hypothetical protein